MHLDLVLRPQAYSNRRSGKFNKLMEEIHLHSAVCGYAIMLQYSTKTDTVKCFQVTTITAFIKIAQHRV